MFKTVAATVLKEFHSTFTTMNGIIVPELKLSFAALQGGRGENMSSDCLQVLTDALGVLRKGVSLFTATTLANVLTIIYCEQYNRWGGVNKFGSRPADLGGPLHIDLVKEFSLPGYGSMRDYVLNCPADQHDLLARKLAESKYQTEHDLLLSLEVSGLKMTTRRLYRDARGHREVDWPNPFYSLPLTNVCDLAPLTTGLTTGLLRSTTEQSQETFLVRFARNQVKLS